MNPQPSLLRPSSFTSGSVTAAESPHPAGADAATLLALGHRLEGVLHFENVVCRKHTAKLGIIDFCARSTPEPVCGGAGDAVGTGASSARLKPRSLTAVAVKIGEVDERVDGIRRDLHDVELE